MMTAIMKLHDAGIVHGDIHTGNICMRNDDGETDDVSLIDFGKSFFLADYPNEIIREPSSWIHALFSPWDIEGYRPGLRDDVFKILLSMSFMINGSQFLDYLVSIESNAVLSYEWKSRRNFFISLGYDFTKTFKNPRTIDRVMGLLTNILSSVREIPTSIQRPPYEWIIAEFGNIIDAVKSDQPSAP